MTNQDLADKIHTHPRCGKYKCEQYVLTVEVISQARAEGYEQANKDIAAKQALIHGEGVMLGGRVVTNEELYKQPTDYVKEAKQEAYEHCVKIAEQHSFDDKCIWHCSLRMAEQIRQAAKELDGKK